ncbi:unnamed protein product [Rotaria sp. Silwood1]|nr:unnamed protein product [Rotaria sp. Silwood1]
MSIGNDYAPDWELASPFPTAEYQMLRSPRIYDFSETPTPYGTNPSYHSSSCSLLQSAMFPEILPLEDIQYSVSDYDCQFSSPFDDNLGDTLPPSDDYLKETLINRPEDEKLLIIAQPKAFYRERYACEFGPEKAQRYIRADDNELKYDYPTVEIPKKWCDSKRDLYIRVTSVTIRSELGFDHCIHPYAIDTQDKNVIKDSKNNSLYFRIYINEFINGEKSFQISRKKMTQSDLISYGPFRLFISNEPDTQRVLRSHSAKSKIDKYELWKSQLIFTLAEKHDDDDLPRPILHTSVISQIMTAITNNKRNNLSNNQVTPKNTTIHVCSSYQRNMNNYHVCNKRKYEDDDYFENDNKEGRISKMTQSSIEQRIIQPDVQISFIEKFTTFDKYLYKLQIALEAFVRNNDLSRLFHHTRCLLSKCDENPLSLNDAIQRGHIQLALSLIEQVFYMQALKDLLEKENKNDATQLLIAAKCNQSTLIELILKYRSDLVEQKDKNGNNLLHLLANLNEDKGAEIIKNVFKILPEPTKTMLLLEKNQSSEIPVDIAQWHSNNLCFDLLNP